MGFMNDILKAEIAVNMDPDLMPGVQSFLAKPRNKTARTLSGLVDYEAIEYDSGVPIPITTVFIAAASITDGWIPSNGDVLMLPTKFGGTIPDGGRTIAKVLNQDAGGWLVKL